MVKFCDKCLKKLKTCVRIFSQKENEGQPSARGINCSSIFEGQVRTLFYFEKSFMEDVYSHQFIKIRNLFHLQRTNLFLRKTILNLVEAKAEYNNKSICNAPSKVFPIQTWTFENQGIPGEEWKCCLNPALTKRHFSQMTKSRIFKNFILRRKSDWSFCRICWKTILGA